MDPIAAEHKKGRRLYVGTTNLGTSGPSSGTWGRSRAAVPGGVHLFRDVLLAASAKSMVARIGRMFFAKLDCDRVDSPANLKRFFGTTEL